MVLKIVILILFNYLNRIVAAAGAVVKFIGYNCKRLAYIIGMWWIFCLANTWMQNF